MISTPRDIVQFSRALDAGTLMTDASRTRMWTPIASPAGAALPYALGWLMQQYRGETLLWHYGLWTGTSALVIKVPARGLTFVLLATIVLVWARWRLSANAVEMTLRSNANIRII